MTRSATRTRLGVLAAATLALSLLSPLSAVRGDAVVAVEARAAKPTLTAPAQVDAGTRVTLKGTAPAGAKVVVQRRQGSRWVALGAATASKGGAWSVKVRYPTAGTVKTRALAAGKPSVVRSVDVYAWLDLAAQPSVMSTAARDLTVSIGTRAFPHSILAIEPDTDNFTAFWRTDRACTDLRYTLGFDAAEKSRADLDETVTSQAYGIRPDDSQATATMAMFAEWTRPQPFALSGLGTSDRILVLVGANDVDKDGLSGVVGTPQLRCRIARLPAMRLGDIPPL